MASLSYISSIDVMYFFTFCHVYGGGAYIISYLIMLILFGLPLCYMELVLGQYARKGPVKLFSEMAPIANGLGCSMVFISCLLAIYWNVQTAWSLFYLFSGFQSELPWTNCTEDFSSRECYQAGACNNVNETYWNVHQSKKFVSITDIN